MGLPRSRRTVMLLGLMSAVVLLGAACSGSGDKSASGSDAPFPGSHHGTTTSTTATPTTNVFPLPPETTTTLETEPPDSEPSATPPSTPDFSNSLDSMLGTIQSVCTDTGHAASVCTCVTDRIRNAEQANQSLDELLSELRDITRECTKGR